MSLLFALGLLVTLATHADAGSGAVTRAMADEALAKVRANDYAGASALFEELARVEPENPHWRNWVARLRSWRGDFRGAEAEYRLILAASGADLEAALGLADVVAWQKRYGEAIRQLELLRDGGPDNAQVLVRLARIHRWKGSYREAAAYLDRAILLAPDNAEIASELRALRERPPAVRGTVAGIESRGATGGSSARAVVGDVTWGAAPGVTLGGAIRLVEDGPHQSRYESLRASWRPTGSTSIRLDAMRASGEDQLPRSSWSVELMQRLARGVSAGLAMQEIVTDRSRTTIESAILDVNPSRRWNLHVRYTPSVTESDVAETSTDGGWAKLTYAPAAVFAPYVVASYGASVREAESIEEQLQSSELSLGVGGSLRVVDEQRLDFGVSRRARSTGGDAWSATVGYRVAF